MRSLLGLKLPNIIGQLHLGAVFSAGLALKCFIDVDLVERSQMGNILTNDVVFFFCRVNFLDNAILNTVEPT